MACSTCIELQRKRRNFKEILVFKGMISPSSGKSVTDTVNTLGLWTLSLAHLKLESTKNSDKFS